MIRSFLILISGIFAVYSYSQDNIKPLLPGENPYINWVMNDSSEIYSGDDLFYLINGGADIYLEYGFRQVAVARYQNPLSNNIRIEIYEMEDAEGAYGIFTMNSLETGRKQDIGDLSLLYDHYVDIWKGNYMIRVNVSRRDPGISDTLLLFAREIDKKITVRGKLPQLQGVIEIDGLDLYQVKYLRGQIALNNIFNFGHGSVAGFKEGITGRFNDNAVFLFAYKDDWNQREWFASANGKMQMSRFFTDFEFVEDGFMIIDRGGNPISFKPYKRFIMVLKGFDWKSAVPYFQSIMVNIDSVYQD